MQEGEPFIYDLLILLFSFSHLNLHFFRLFAAGVLKCPSHVQLYQAWACLEMRAENIERAKILISEALTRDKSHGSSWLIAAKIEEKLGNRGLVGLILRRGLECSPYDPELYRVSAEFEAKGGLFHKVRVDSFSVIRY